MKIKNKKEVIRVLNILFTSIGTVQSNKIIKLFDDLTYLWAPIKNCVGDKGHSTWTIAKLFMEYKPDLNLLTEKEYNLIKPILFSQAKRRNKGWILLFEAR